MKLSVSPTPIRFPEKRWKIEAIILKAPKSMDEKSLELVHILIPEPGPSEILVRVSMCGLCHTELHPIEGNLELPVLPISPGHWIGRNS